MGPPWSVTSFCTSFLSKRGGKSTFLLHHEDALLVLHNHIRMHQYSVGSHQLSSNDREDDSNAQQTVCFVLDGGHMASTSTLAKCKGLSNISSDIVEPPDISSASLLATSVRTSVIDRPESPYGCAALRRLA